jgi:nitrogen fixation protein FixH
MSVARTVESNELEPEVQAKLLWVGIIVGLLGLQAIMCFVAAFLATKDPSFAVVPDYHRRSLAWDADRAEQAASDRLGWKMATDVDPQADVLGRRRICIDLQGPGGKPIEGATVSATIFHRARAGDVQTIRFSERSSGHYQAEPTMRRAGLWEIRIKAERDQDHFRQTVVHELTFSKER